MKLLKALAIVPAFVLAGSAAAAELSSVNFQILTVKPRTEDIALMATLPSWADGQRLLDWMYKNGTVTEAAAGAVALDNGVGHYSTMKPVVITSPDPKVTIGPDGRQVGVDVAVKYARVFENQALVQVNIEYSHFTGQKRVMYTTPAGHDIITEQTQLLRMNPSVLIPLDGKLAQYTYEDGLFTIVVLSPQTR